MRGKHGLRDRTKQVSTQRVEVDLVTQAVAEEIERARGVLARAVEAAVYRVLHAAADRLEERENSGPVRPAALLLNAISVRSGDQPTSRKKPRE